MQTWSISLHGPSGIISTVDTGEAQFVIGTETASDVFSVQGDGIAPRHAWVWISEAGVQVEDLGGGTLVNGCQISERVQVEYPASVQVGDVTLVIEVKAVQPVAVFPTSSSLDITIPPAGGGQKQSKLGGHDTAEDSHTIECSEDCINRGLFCRLKGSKQSIADL